MACPPPLLSGSDVWRILFSIKIFSDSSFDPVFMTYKSSRYFVCLNSFINFGSFLASF